MLEKIKKEMRHELFRGSIVLFILLNFFNIFNIFFQFGSGRLLGPEGYGILSVMMGLIYLFTIPSESIQTIITKYTTKFSNSPGKIKGLFYQTIKRFSIYGVILFLIFLAISPLLSSFLDIKIEILALTGITLLCLFIVPVVRGVLQGRKKFNKLGWTFFAEGLVKLVLAIGLIFLGLGVFGPLIAVIASLVFALILSLFFVRDIFKAKKQNINIKGFRAYSLPVLVSIACLTVFFSLDVILVKRFFTLQEVGLYAALSMIGKVVYFGANPISRALFPLVSEKFEKGKNTRSLLKRALTYTFILSLIAILIYIFIPGFLVNLIYGEKFLEISKWIWISGLTFSLLAFSQMFIFYFLSKNKKINVVLVSSVIIQIIIIYFFHSSLFQYILAILCSNAILLILLFLNGIYART